MKILFFARRFYPLIGGVEKHCLLLGKELLKRGHQLTIVTEWDYREIKKDYAGEPPKFVVQEEYQGIKIIRIPVKEGGLSKKWQIWSWFIGKQALIKEADLIHCHDVFYWFLPFRLFYPKKKVFVTFHGYEGSQPPNWRKRFSHQLADKLSQGNICIGDFQAKWYGVKPSFVSYGAVECGTRGEKWEVAANTVSGFDGVKSREVGGGGEYKYDLCYVGRLAEDVGITVYLEALKILKERGLNLSMVVCGDGPLMEASKKYAEQESLNVNFMGFVNNPLEILERSKVALISRYLGILEALLIGKPIVAVYDNQIKKDYLKLAPFVKWISIVGKPAEVANYIDSRLHGNDKESGIILETARLWAKKQTWGKMTDLYLNLWQQKSV